MFPFLLSSCQAKIIYCLVEKTSEAEVSLQVGNHSPDQWCSAGTATLRDEQDFQGQTANRQCRGNIHPAGTCTLLQFACSESHHRLLKAIKTDFASLSAEVCSSRISLKAWCIRKLLPPHHFSTCTLTVTSWYSFLVGFFSSISRRAFFFFSLLFFFFFPPPGQKPQGALAGVSCCQCLPRWWAQEQPWLLQEWGWPRWDSKWHGPGARAQALGLPCLNIPPGQGSGGSRCKAILMKSFFTCFPISLIEFGLLKSGHQRHLSWWDDGLELQRSY